MSFLAAAPSRCGGYRLYLPHSSLVCQIIALSHTVDERDRRIAELTVTLSNLRAEILTARDAFKQENEKLVKQLSMKTQLIAEKTDRVIDLDDKLAKVQCAPPLQSRPLQLVPKMRAPRGIEGSIGAAQVGAGLDESAPC